MSLTQRKMADGIYSFVYRGELAQESLERIGSARARRESDLAQIRQSLSINLLDDEKVKEAERMAVVYVAIASFESGVRDLIEQVLLEDVGEDWWSQCVPERVRKKAESRKQEEVKRKFHTQRGGRLLDYTDMGDLHSIFIKKWEQFEDVIGTDLDWVKNIVKGLESSRNVIMHGGVLDGSDIQRVGMFIRDWVKQVGA